MVVRSKPENGIFRTASTPFSAFAFTGFWGTVSMTTATCGSASRIPNATCWPEMRPCSSASTITTSGLYSDAAATARSPAVTTSSILIWDCACSSARMCDATCGTSSTTRSLICSIVKSFSPARSLRSARGQADHEDPSYAVILERVEIVRTIGSLHRQAGFPDERRERVGIWIPEPMAGRKPRYRTIGLPHVDQCREGHAQPFWRLPTHELAAADDFATVQGSPPINR